MKDFVAARTRRKGRSHYFKFRRRDLDGFGNEGKRYQLEKIKRGEGKGER